MGRGLESKPPGLSSALFYVVNERNSIWRGRRGDRTIRRRVSGALRANPRLCSRPTVWWAQAVLARLLAHSALRGETSGQRKISDSSNYSWRLELDLSVWSNFIQKSRRCPHSRCFETGNKHSWILRNSCHRTFLKLILPKFVYLQEKRQSGCENQLKRQFSKVCKENIIFIYLFIRHHRSKSKRSLSFFFHSAKTDLVNSSHPRSKADSE